MVSVKAKPFLHHLIANLEKSKFQKIVISTGYFAENIETYFANHKFGLNIEFCREMSPLGTGGAAKICGELLNNEAQFIINGDTFCVIDYAELFHIWETTREPVMATVQVENTSRYGRIQTDGQRVINMKEKGICGPGLISAGCYLLPKTIYCNSNLPDKFSIETELIDPIIQKRKMRFKTFTGYFVDIGVPSDLARARLDLPV